VAETICSLTLLMNSLGLRTEWRVIQGTPDFFSITKKMHNALQGGENDTPRGPIHGSVNCIPSWAMHARIPRSAAIAPSAR
jgi:hypothetical protein